MKLSTFVSFTLVISGVFFLFAMMAYDANQQFPGSVNSTFGTIDDSGNFTSQYNFLSQLNSTVAPLQQKFGDIQNPDTGFFTKLAAGITAMPYAVILLPQVIFGSFVTGGAITTGFLVAFAIPGYIITIALVMIIIWGLFKLLEYFQRTPV